MTKLLFILFATLILSSCATPNLEKVQENLLDKEQNWKPINTKEIQKEMEYV